MSYSYLTENEHKNSNEKMDLLINECKKYKIKIFEQDKYQFISNFRNLHTINEKKKAKFLNNLKDLFSDVELDLNKNKSIFIYSPKKYTVDHFIVIYNGSYFTFLSNFYQHAGFSVWDSNLNFIYRKTFYSMSRYAPDKLVTDKYQYNINNKHLSAYLFNYKGGPCYVNKINNNLYDFDISGSPRIKQMVLNKDTINVKFHSSNYNLMTFDKSFNIKKLYFSDSFYREIKSFMSSKKIDIDNFDSIETILEDSFTFVSLMKDKELSFTSKKTFEHQLTTLKEVLFKKETFEIPTSVINNILNEFSSLDDFLNELRSRNDTHKNYFSKGMQHLTNEINSYFLIFDKLTKGTLDPVKEKIINEIKILNTYNTLSIPEKEAVKRK